MEGLPVIDTNIFLRHIAGDHADHSPRATALLERVEEGRFVACTADTVIFEVVFTLQSFYRMPREAIRDAFQPLLVMPGLRVPRKGNLIEALELFVTNRALSFADCLHAIIARGLSSPEFVSFDQDFGRLPWLNRTEPT
jgi:predicted nucleic acid-binding protein